MVDFGTVTSPQKKHHWTSLVVVQWLRLHAPNAGTQVPSPVLIRQDTTKKKERKERKPITFGSHFPFPPKPPILSTRCTLIYFCLYRFDYFDLPMDLVDPQHMGA